MNDTTTGTSPEVPRDRMVDPIPAAQRRTPAPAVEAALRQVERHRHIPDRPDCRRLRRASRHHPTPSPTAPPQLRLRPTVAAMLNALDVQPGHQILETGAGTGYNAALLATLAGARGVGTTIDINPDVTAAARHNLDATGFDRVMVLTGDGALGAPDHSPVRPRHRQPTC
jgi:protein-L-isoaspartate(D-aspartate) O-methyltransferase